MTEEEVTKVFEKMQYNILFELHTQPSSENIMLAYLKRFPKSSKKRRVLKKWVNKSWDGKTSHIIRNKILKNSIPSYTIGVDWAAPESDKTVFYSTFQEEKCSAAGIPEKYLNGGVQ